MKNAAKRINLKKAFTPTPIAKKAKQSNQLVRGFTLVEIMIVVAIVMVLITLAVPNILRSRVVTNEAAALANLTTITNACQVYYSGKRAYPGTLMDLTEPVSSPPYIDSVLASGTKQGYQYIYELVNDDHFTLNANPTSGSILKGRYFYTDEGSIVHARNGAQAGPDDEIVK